MDRLRLLLATGFGVGYAPIAPGTAGSALGIAIIWLLDRAGGSWWVAGGFVVFTLVGFWSASGAERHFGRKDPGPVVIDEIAGQLLTLCFLPITPLMLIIGFFLFRVLDIFKPPPARRLESIGGGSGIMADDLMVAVYGNLLLQILVRLFPRIVEF